MAENNNIKDTMGALFKGMDSFISSKTVVGEPIYVEDTTIIPLVDANFGVAAGAFSNEKKDKGAGGMGGKVTPSAILVISKGNIKLVNIKNQDGLSKVLDMVPGIVNRFSKKGSKMDVKVEKAVLKAAKLDGEGQA